VHLLLVEIHANGGPSLGTSYISSAITISAIPISNISGQLREEFALINQDDVHVSSFLARSALKRTEAGPHRKIKTEEGGRVAITQREERRR
jgi:hypothetical protein